MSWRDHPIHEARSSLTIWRRKERHFFLTGGVLRNSAEGGTKWSMVCVFLHLACPMFCPTPGQQSGVESSLKIITTRSMFKGYVRGWVLSQVSGTIYPRQGLYLQGVSYVQT